LIEKHVTEPDAETTEVYLCGGQQMIEDCKARLMAKGFPETVLHHENFY
jgi:ferredoxin-NADP reductase